MRNLRNIAGAAAAFCAFATGAHAQGSASAAVNATVHVSGVRSVALSAGGVNNLVFGIVSAGSSHTPASVATDAGRFGIAGEQDAPITVAFILPSVLTGPGGATIPIAFSGTDGLDWVAFPISFVTFNPNAPYLTTLNVIGQRFIGISGTINPPSATTTGFYSGTITLVVSY